MPSAQGLGVAYIFATTKKGTGKCCLFPFTILACAKNDKNAVWAGTMASAFVGNDSRYLYYDHPGRYDAKSSRSSYKCKGTHEEQMHKANAAGSSRL